MPTTQAPTDISKFDIGPAVNVSITLELLQLLSKTATFALARPSLVPLSTEEQRAIENFAGLVTDTVNQEANNPVPGTLYGFCL